MWLSYTYLVLHLSYNCPVEEPAHCPERPVPPLHKTSWLGLKYFEFCTIGDIGMLELLAQDLQRHEVSATPLWIPDCFLVFVSLTVRPLFDFIDGGPECIFSCTEMESTGRIHGWAFDEWHNNQNYNKNVFPLLGRDAHGFISQIHSLQYGDDIRTQLQIYQALETACSELGYGVDVTWESSARQPLFLVTNDVPRDQRGRRCPRHRRLVHEQTLQ